MDITLVSLFRNYVFYKNPYSDFTIMVVLKFLAFFLIAE